MANSDFFSFIRKVKENTRTNKIRWERYNETNPSAYSLETQANKNGSVVVVQFIIDKYLSVSSEDTEIVCVNFAILEKNGSIIQDIVRCNNTSEQALDEYNQLNDFYSTIEKNFEHFKISFDIPVEV